VELQELSPPAKIRKSNSGSRRLPAVQNVKSRSSYLWSVVVVPEKSNCFEGEDEQIIEKVVEIEDENIQTIGKLKNVRVEVKAVKFARTAFRNEPTTKPRQPRHQPSTLTLITNTVHNKPNSQKTKKATPLVTIQPTTQLCGKPAPLPFGTNLDSGSQPSSGTSHTPRFRSFFKRIQESNTVNPAPPVKFKFPSQS
jgi:hypothetical protein